MSRGGITTVLAWMPALACAAWALLRLSGIDPPYPLFPLLAFTPWIIVAGALAAIWALALRRPVAAVVAGTAALLLGVVVAPRVLGTEQPHIDGPELTVMASNLQFGAADQGVLAELVRDHGVDAISFEELTPAAARELSRGPLARLMPHRILDPQSGGFGSGIVSALPMRKLPSPSVDATKHPVLAAELRLGGGAKAELWSIHPEPPSGGEQTDGLTSYLDSIPPPDPAGPPLLLAGDFNSTIDHLSLIHI